MWRLGLGFSLYRGIFVVTKEGLLLYSRQDLGPQVGEGPPGVQRGKQHELTCARHALLFWCVMHWNHCVYVVIFVPTGRAFHIPCQAWAYGRHWCVYVMISKPISTTFDIPHQVGTCMCIQSRVHVRMSKPHKAKPLTPQQVMIL